MRKNTEPLPGAHRGLRSRRQVVHVGMRNDYEVIIVGGGPAGLSGALALARCGRSLLVCDAGSPRNVRSDAMHGFLTRDGTPPAEFLRLGREELRRYGTVDFVDLTVTDAVRTKTGFKVVFADGQVRFARKLLLATGLVDELPPIEGLAPRWGRSVFPCPFCDALEFRGQPLAVLGHDPIAGEFCLELLTWTRDLTLLGHGVLAVGDDVRQRLTRMNIAIDARRILRLEGKGERLTGVRFEGGDVLACRALFLCTRQHQRSPLAEKLGCAPLTPDQTVSTDSFQHTRQRGVYVAGNAAEGLQMAILAAAEGFKAGYAINDELVDDLIAAEAQDQESAAMKAVVRA